MSNLEKPVVEPVVEEKTPEEELELLKNNELWLKDQLKKPDNLLAQMYGSNSPKKDVIVEWADNLESQHELEVKLGKEPTLKSVGEISSYIKTELRGLGVHESTYAYVHEILGHKYKNNTKINKRFLNEEVCEGKLRINSSNPIAENESLIDTINQQINFLKSFRTKATQTNILSALDPIQLLNYQETNLQIQATILFASQVIDDRQSVPVLAQLKLIMAVVAATNNFAAGMYVSQIKKFGANKMVEGQDFFHETSNGIVNELPENFKQTFKDVTKGIRKLRKKFQLVKNKKTLKSDSSPKRADIMTSKQAMKIVFGGVKSVLPVFDHREDPGHQDRDGAIMDGYYGIACPECGSLRVAERMHPASGDWMCFCYKCEWWFEAKTVSKCWNCHIPFFDDILDVVMKSAVDVTNKKGEPTGAKESKCPRCDKKVVLPLKIFKRIKIRSR